jgi:hypothetical protein
MLATFAFVVLRFSIVIVHMPVRPWLLGLYSRKHAHAAGLGGCASAGNDFTYRGVTG